MDAFTVDVVGGWPTSWPGSIVVAREGPHASTPGLTKLLTEAGTLAVARLDDGQLVALEPFNVDHASDWNPLLQIEFHRGGHRLLVAPETGEWWLLDAIDLEVTFFCGHTDLVSSVFEAAPNEPVAPLGSWLPDDIVTPQWQRELEQLGRRYGLAVTTDRSPDQAQWDRYATGVSRAVRSMDQLRSPCATAQHLLQVNEVLKPPAAPLPSWHGQLKDLVATWKVDPAERDVVERDLRQLIARIGAETR